MTVAGGSDDRIKHALNGQAHAFVGDLHLRVIMWTHTHQKHDDIRGSWVCELCKSQSHGNTTKIAEWILCGMPLSGRWVDDATGSFERKSISYGYGWMICLYETYRHTVKCLFNSRRIRCTNSSTISDLIFTRAAQNMTRSVTAKRCNIFIIYVFCLNDIDLLSCFIWIKYPRAFR